MTGDKGRSLATFRAASSVRVNRIRGPQMLSVTTQARRTSLHVEMTRRQITDRDGEWDEVGGSSHACAPVSKPSHTADSGRI